MRAYLILVLMLAFATPGSAAEQPFPAHRVFGNTYYVGSQAIAVYLVTTPEGHVLINSGFEETVPLIRESVKSLGFKLSDVKFLLASHAHSDHVAGHALLKQLTGAKVVVMRGDHEVIASGGQGQYLYADSRWRPCPVDRVIDDLDAVALGGVQLTARRTPGHTRGCTTWTWEAREGDQKRQVVVVGSPNVNPGYQLVNNPQYPEIADDYRRGFAILKALSCEIFLGAHGAYYGLPEKFKQLGQRDENPFVDPDGYRAYITERQRAFEQKLNQQSQ